MLTSISSATRKARSTACCLLVCVHTTIPCWYCADRQNSAHHWGIWKKRATECCSPSSLYFVFTDLWNSLYITVHFSSKPNLCFLWQFIPFRIVPNDFCLSTPLNKQWQEISYGIIAHNAKLLWQHVAAPADQGLAAGGPLTPHARSLCAGWQAGRRAGRLELGRRHRNTTASAELGSLCTLTHMVLLWFYNKIHQDQNYV